MSSNFLIESDDDVYSAAPTYTFLWQTPLMRTSLKILA